MYPRSLEDQSKTVGMSTTRKDTSNSYGPTNFKIYLTRYRCFDAIKRSHHHPIWASHRVLNVDSAQVMAQQTYRADPLSMRTLEMIIPQHSTVIWSGLTCHVPSDVSSSLLKVILLVPTIYPTICSRSFFGIPCGI